MLRTIVTLNRLVGRARATFEALGAPGAAANVAVALERDRAEVRGVEERLSELELFRRGDAA